MVKLALEACDKFSQGWDNFRGCIDSDELAKNAEAVKWVYEIGIIMQKVDRMRKKVRK